MKQIWGKDFYKSKLKVKLQGRRDYRIGTPSPGGYFDVEYDYGVYRNSNAVIKPFRFSLSTEASCCGMLKLFNLGLSTGTNFEKMAELFRPIAKSLKAGAITYTTTRYQAYVRKLLVKAQFTSTGTFKNPRTSNVIEMWIRKV